MAGMSASDKADVVDAAAASYKFPVDKFTRALKAVDVLGLKWSTRAQRAVLRGATMEQRVIAFLLAERIYAAKLRKVAAAKVYCNVARQSHLALKAAEDFGPHGMAYVNSQAIKDGYQGPFKADTIAAVVASAAKDRAASAAAEEPEKDKGKGKAVAARAGAHGTAQRTVAAASIGMSKAAMASAAEESAGMVKAAAAAAVKTDDDDVVIVNVFLSRKTVAAGSAGLLGACKPKTTTCGGPVTAAGEAPGGAAAPGWANEVGRGSFARHEPPQDEAEARVAHRDGYLYRLWQVCWDTRTLTVRSRPRGWESDGFCLLVGVCREGW